MLTDTRAVSTVVGYAITLGIVTLLVTGLLVAGGTFVEDQRQGAIRGEMEVFSQQVSSQLVGVDRLAVASGSGTTARLSRQLPDEVTGRTYLVEVSDEASGPSLVSITLRSQSPEVSVTASVWLRTDVTDTTLAGGPILVTYDGGSIEVRSA